MQGQGISSKGPVPQHPSRTGPEIMASSNKSAEHEASSGRRGRSKGKPQEQVRVRVRVRPSDCQAGPR